MLDLETGDLIWSAGKNGNHNLVLDGDGGTAPMEHSIPAPVRVLDLSGDGVADRMYAADMGGRVWRFDIINGETSGDDLVEGGLLASLGAADMEKPRRAGRPSLLRRAGCRRRNRRTEIPYLAVNLGSGFRASPLETTTDGRVLLGSRLRLPRA